MWVGLSAKKASNAEVIAPLHVSTRTGKLVAEIEAQCHHVCFYKTNLVNFPPMDHEGKLRYPTLEECELCYPEFQDELQATDPRIVLLLGHKTATFILDNLGLPMPMLSFDYHAVERGGRWYVPIHHPSYIMVYKRKEKEKYIQSVRNVIERLL